MEYKMRQVNDFYIKLLRMNKLLYIPVFLSAVLSCSPAGNVAGERWTDEEAAEWYASHDWIAGCNFIPSYAINQLEMWQEDTFDPEAIDRELGWAEELGFNCMRVFLHHVLWETDREGFNAIVEVLEAYVKDIMTEFRDDDRILMWDLYNEPGGGQDPDRYWERSFPLLKSVFGWAREVDPSQPVTAGIWSAELGEMNVWQIENSDIVTYHTYEGPEQHRHLIDTLKAYGRPMICTEYMARTQGSTFQTIMPILREENIGAINWGLVSGKTNTIFAWATPLEADEPEVWFHDILRQDGTPYSLEEADCIRSLTRYGKNSLKSGAQGLVE